MKTIEEYRVSAQEIYSKLHLATYPVAIKYIKSSDEIPEKAMRPSAAGKKLALCQAFTLARRWGTTVALTSDDNFCTPATVMHRWENVAMDDMVESQVRQGWHRDREAEIRRFQALSDLLGQEYITRPKQYVGLICSPLTKAPFIPDSILIYGDGVQITHIIHALSYEYKHVPISSFEGFGESCMKGGLAPFVAQKPQVVIPGSGDRAFAAISEYEIGIGMPALLIFYVIDNLFKSGGHMNIGFPLKTMLPMDLTEKLTPGFKYLREKIDHSK